ncbi:hypothetical protein Gotur_016525 [Gossypium turneri]
MNPILPSPYSHLQNTQTAAISCFLRLRHSSPSSKVSCVPSGGIKVAWDTRELNNQSAWEGAEWALAGSACEREVKFQTWSEIETLYALFIFTVSVDRGKPYSLESSFALSYS